MGSVRMDSGATGAAHLSAEAPDFPDFPDDARLWIFAANRQLSPGERELSVERTERFLAEWAAHGEAMAAASQWRYDRFLLVAADERSATASGCSIDALVRHVKELEKELGLDLVDASSIWYRGRGEIHRVSRAEFRRLAAQGEVDGGTVVFDQTVQRLGDLRSGRWELPAESSWHARLIAAN